MQDDIVQDFIDETREIMQLAEQRLMTLEHDPDDAPAIADLFRMIHTIKGNSRFLDLGDLETVAHSAEMVLDAYRRGLLRPDRESVGLLLSAVDAIGDEISALAGDQDAPPDRAALVQALNGLASKVHHSRSA
jgi:two-component system, chemotaxis family, sensor kinase CheA